MPGCYSFLHLVWLLYQQANGIRLKEVAKSIALGDTGPLTLLAFRPQLFVSGETTEQAPDQASTNTPPTKHNFPGFQSL